MTGTVVQVLLQIAVQILAMLTMPVFWLMAAMLAAQMWLIQKKNQKQVVVWLPAFLFAWLECWLLTVLTGILGGVIASVLFLLTGISLPIHAMLYLWSLMLFLYWIQRRFFCFAYAGGLLTLIQCFTEYLGVTILDFDCASVLLLVAVLHFTEAVLVRLGGALQRVPVYFRGKQGNTTAMTQLQMSWLIPLAMPMPAAQIDGGILQGGCFVLPAWWPLFGIAPEPTDITLLYYLIPTLAVISYRDLALYGKEIKQSRRASGLLCVYSLCLCILVWLCGIVPKLLPIAALFAILGHERILQLGQISMRKYVHDKKE